PAADDASTRRRDDRAAARCLGLLQEALNGIVEHPRTRVERPGELRLLALDRGEDGLTAFGQVRVGLDHDVDHDLAELSQERLAPAPAPAPGAARAAEPAGGGA